MHHVLSSEVQRRALSIQNKKIKIMSLVPVYGNSYSNRDRKKKVEILLFTDKFSHAAPL